MNHRFDFLCSTTEILIQFLEQIESVHVEYFKQLSKVKRNFENVEISCLEFNKLFKKCLETPRIKESKSLEFTTQRNKFNSLRTLLQEKEENGNTRQELENLNLDFTILLLNIFKELEIVDLSLDLREEIRDFDVQEEISSFNQIQGQNGQKRSKKSILKRISKVFTGFYGRKSVVQKDIVKETMAEIVKETVNVDEEGYTIPKESIYEYADKKLQDSDEELGESLKLIVKINDEAKKDQGVEELDLVNAVSTLKVELEKNPRLVMTPKETFPEIEHQKTQAFKEISNSIQSEQIKQENTDLEIFSDPFVVNDSKNSLLSNVNDDLEVDLRITQEINVIIDQGSVKKANATGIVNLCIPDSWPRTQIISLEFHDLSIFQELITLSDIIIISDSKAQVNLSSLAHDILEIPILKFTLNQSCIELPIQVIHTIWKQESDSNSLMVLFNYKCTSNEIQDLQIEAFITLENETTDIKTQSKPEAVWNQEGKFMVWKASPETFGKLLAKFESSTRLSAGIINLTYRAISNGSSISVNGRLSQSMISYKCVCT